MGLFSRKAPELPSYSGSTIEQLLSDPVWNVPLGSAGITQSGADYLRLVGTVTCAAPGISFDKGPMTGMVMSGPCVLAVHAGSLALAIPDKREVRVIRRSADTARLMVSRFDRLQLVWGGDAARDGWTFDDLKVTEASGREVGDALRQWVKG